MQEVISVFFSNFYPVPKLSTLSIFFFYLANLWTYLIALYSYVYYSTWSTPPFFNTFFAFFFYFILKLDTEVSGIYQVPLNTWLNCAMPLEAHSSRGLDASYTFITVSISFSKFSFLPFQPSLKNNFKKLSWNDNCVPGHRISMP